MRLTRILTACGLLAGRLFFGYFLVAVDKKVSRSQALIAKEKHISIRLRNPIHFQCRLVKTIDALGGIIQYDSNGNHTKVIASNGATTTFAYDSFNQLIKEKRCGLAFGGAARGRE